MGTPVAVFSVYEIVLPLWSGSKLRCLESDRSARLFGRFEMLLEHGPHQIKVDFFGISISDASFSYRRFGKIVTERVHHTLFCRRRSNCLSYSSKSLQISLPYQKRNLLSTGDLANPILMHDTR